MFVLKHHGYDHLIKHYHQKKIPKTNYYCVTHKGDNGSGTSNHLVKYYHQKKIPKTNYYFVTDKGGNGLRGTMDQLTPLVPVDTLKDHHSNFYKTNVLHSDLSIFMWEWNKRAYTYTSRSTMIQ